MNIRKLFIHTHRSLYRFMLVGLLAMAVSPKATGQSIDFFSGVELNLKDIDYQRQYDVLIYLTPGFKWDMGKHWQLTGNVYVPIINQFGEQYGYVRPNIFVLSKQLRTGPLYLKGSAGLFSYNRYGLDLKAFLPVSKWLAFEAQAGYVGLMYMIPEWTATRPDRFAGTIGGDIYLTRWNCQLRGIAGRFLYQDYGVIAEAMRHFNHTTVSVYGCWHNTWNHKDEFDAGFKVVVMIPPYHRKQRVVNFRPASNYRLTYAVMYYPYSNIMYWTDPEENNRDGWFDRDLLNWGIHTMAPDFVIERKEIKE
ncbi:MAG: hypothetical protein J5641_06155 [Bacteroidales bacterium]|nr:hypothetical protein [Bacteroidales bacterium]